MRRVPQDRLNGGSALREAEIKRRYAVILATTAIVMTSPSVQAGGVEPCSGYGTDAPIGSVAIDGIDEVSGVVASRREPVLWIEEDSGNPERVYAIDDAGNMRARVQVQNADNRDWEDIALTGHRLWIADIGDNGAQRASIRVYWFKEPELSATSADARLLTLTYDDRVARNAEAMVVDGDRKKLFVFTKAPGTSLVFKAPVDHLHGGEAAVLRRIAELPLNEVTAADLGPDGIVVKSGDGYLYRWAPDHRVRTALAGAPCRVPAGPGESIAFSSDDRGLYAIPEGSDPPIYFTPAA